MFHKKKYTILLVLIILTCVFLVIVLLPISNPADVIKRKIDVTLPASAKIIHFNYNKFTGNFYAKVQINNQDVESIQKDLLDYFRQEYDIENSLYFPNIKNNIQWWDVDKNNIEVCYKALIDGEKHWFVPTPKTTIVWAFIVKQNDGKYYLYISY